MNPQDLHYVKKLIVGLDFNGTIVPSRRGFIEAHRHQHLCGEDDYQRSVMIVRYDRELQFFDDRAMLIVERYRLNGDCPYWKCEIRNEVH